MKITASQLRSIIREEVQRSLEEAPSSTRSAAAKRGAATRAAGEAQHRAYVKRRGPTWPGYLHDAPRPDWWDEADYEWNERKGKWERKASAPPYPPLGGM